MINKAAIIKRKRILGVDFDFTDYENVLETIQQWKRRSEKHYITLSNPHSVLLCRRNQKMAQATAAAAMTLPDGVGIILAANLLGYENKGRVTGPTLMLRLSDWGCRYNFRHFFYGGAQGVAKRLAKRFSRVYPGLQVAGTYCPPFRPISDKEDEQIVGMINGTKPDIVWVGLGAPKQEKWMADHLGKIRATAMIGVGAAFDFNSGNVKWAPHWMRKCGLEWVYRFAQDPKRMWRRNLDSPIFLLKVMWQRLATAMNNDRHGATINQLLKIE
jgi:N-acetylglucosaminyldiphosphoundecaprenol N-acetyl-beta-D-mannosaminyltransferase